METYKNGDSIETRNGYRGRYIGPTPRGDGGMNYHWVLLDDRPFAEATLIRECNLRKIEPVDLTDVPVTELKAELARKAKENFSRLLSNRQISRQVGDKYIQMSREHHPHFTMSWYYAAIDEALEMKDEEGQ